MLSYLPAVAPVIAIVNSVIAVYATQFKPEDNFIKVVLLSIAIAFGSVAAVATVWSQFHTLQKQQADKQRNLETRLQLAQFIGGANGVLRNLQDSSVEKAQALSGADTWNEGVVNFLKTLGDDYIVRFVDASGLSPIIPNGVTDEERKNYWTSIYHRNTRLGQFIAEFTKS